MVRLMVLYRPWWLVLDGTRMLIRAAVEARRNSMIWPLAMTLRWAAHVAVGSPWLALWAVTLLVAGPRRGLLVGGLIACVVCELVALAAKLLPGVGGIGFWTFRRGVAVRKRWPRAWGDYAGRTKQVQAATGAEPSTPVRWRPLVDHPRLSWLFWPTTPNEVQFIVGPPPDRTYVDLVSAAAAMAAKFSFVESFEVDYASDRSSLAVLTVRFTGHGHDTPVRAELYPVPDLEPDTWLDPADEEVAS